MNFESQPIIDQVIEFLDNDYPHIDIPAYLNDELSHIAKKNNITIKIDSISEQVVEFLDSDLPAFDIKGYLGDEFNAIKKQLSEGK